VPKRAERLAWLTGFTGSAGLAIVLTRRRPSSSTALHAAVRNQTDTNLFETLDLMNDGPTNWLEANLVKGAKLGYDPWLAHPRRHRAVQDLDRARQRERWFRSTQCGGSDLARSARAAACARSAPTLELTGETSAGKTGGLAED